MHLAIDVCLLWASVWVVQDHIATLRSPPDLWNQTTFEVYDPNFLREGPTPQPIKALALGTLPAAIFPSVALPNGWRASSPFDVMWASLHVALAFVFWYVVGRFLEGKERNYTRFAWGLILLRLVSLPTCFSFWPSLIGMVRDLSLMAWWLVALLVTGAALWKQSLRRSPTVAT